jgi:hypothetical protein
MNLEPGRGLRIAVIDSGVNPSHPHIGRIAGGVTITADSEDEDYIDRLGHGTAVMAAIQEKAPAADYFAVRIFERGLKANVDVLVRALEWCVLHQMDLINLSLGTTNPAHAERFTFWRNSAILVSARFAGTEPAYPGSMEGAISVEADPGIPRDHYGVRIVERQIAFLASPYPRPISGLPPERNLSGASFAVANMTGFVARACTGSAKVSYEDIHDKLLAGAVPSHPRGSSSANL